MRQKLSQIFKEISEVNPPEKLGDLILRKIDLEKEKVIKRKLFLSYFGMALSFVLGAPALFHFGSAFLKSEFLSLLSLAFSDFILVATSWKEFLYSLGETLPVLYIIAMLIPIFGMLAFASLFISLRNSRHHMDKSFGMHFQH